MAEQNIAAREVCEHYYAWVSVGAKNSARICMLCHLPCPDWLDHIVEVDMSDTCKKNPCVDCEFGVVLDPRQPKD